MREIEVTLRNSRRAAGRRATVLAVVAVAALAAVLGALVVGSGALPRALRLPDQVTRDRPSPSATPTPLASPPPQPAPAVLPTAASSGTARSGEAAAQAARAARVADLLSQAEVGSRRGAFVIEPATGRVLLELDAATPRAPASLAKLAVCAAALLTAGPGTRLQTRVVTGKAPSEVVLVGAGDTTLAIERPRTGAYPARASLAALAAATADRLRGRARLAVTVRVDDSLFTGPAVSPAWQPGYVRAGVVAPVQALMVRSGRVRTGSNVREADPALAAGRHFARLLAREGIGVRGDITRTTAAAGAEVLAAASSAPLATLVEVVLKRSDNDLAESLSRLAARSVGQPASFDGATQALPTILGRAGLDARSLRLLDGSGLARGSRMSPELAARLVALSTTHPRLRPLATGLPVAGFSGTLADRFDTRGARGGAGLVRAKTGTLTGVTGLAGLAATESGSVVAFAMVADGVSPTQAVRASRVLDRATSLLTGPSERRPPGG